MKGLKITVIIIVAVGVLCSLIPIFLYIDNFSGKGIATDQNVWGTFGDFLGGTINPIIGIINLAILIAISVYVAKFDSHRQFNEYRYTIYVEMCKRFDDTDNSSDSLFKLHGYLEVFKLNNQFLFPGKSNPIFNKLISSLQEKTKALEVIREEFEENVANGNIQVFQLPKKLGRDLEEGFKDWPKVDTPETLALKAFSHSKNKLISFIQAVMIEKNLKEFNTN